MHDQLYEPEKELSWKTRSATASIGTDSQHQRSSVSSVRRKRRSRSEAYSYIGSWFWDQEIFDYLLEKMPLLREPDVRIVTKAYDLKLSAIPGLHWKSAIDQHMADPAHQMVAEYLGKDEADFGGREQRIDAWTAAVKAQDPQASASRATWHRYKKKVERLLDSPRPNRIVLERNAPHEEFRPFDSPIGSRCDVAAADLA